MSDLDKAIEDYKARRKDVQVVIDSDTETEARKRMAVAHMKHINDMLKTLQVAKFGVIAKYVKPA